MLSDDPEEINVKLLTYISDKNILLQCFFSICLIMVLLIFFIDVHLIKNDLHRIANSIEKVSE